MHIRDYTFNQLHVNRYKGKTIAINYLHFFHVQAKNIAFCPESVFHVLPDSNDF